MKCELWQLSDTCVPLLGQSLPPSAPLYTSCTLMTLHCPPQVFELGGEVVQPALAHSLMRLIAEGAGEDDEQADAELRGQAVQSYLELLEKPKLPQVLLQVSKMASDRA